MKSLKHWISLGTVVNLPQSSSWKAVSKQDMLQTFKEYGFEGIFGVEDEIDAPLFERMGLHFGQTISYTDDTVLTKMQKATDRGAKSITLHIGNGFESDDTVYHWIENILSFSSKNIPVLIETHRGTVTQDPFRTLRLIERFPEIRFTGDFSHWYTGTLMANDFDKKIKLIKPILSRCDVIHGRFASSGAIQTPYSFLSTESKLHIKQLWLGVLEENISKEIIFAPELLSHSLDYELSMPTATSLNTREEISDRWLEALQMKELISKWNQEIYTQSLI